MIVFDLRCGRTHVFEAWFGSGADYESQRGRGLIACPLCGDTTIGKAAMAPAVPAKGNRGIASTEHAPEAPSEPPAEGKRRLAALLAVQRAMEASCDYVGLSFAAEARAIHAGETPARGIYGEATLADAAALAADGVAVAPLPFRPRVRDDA